MQHEIKIKHKGNTLLKTFEMGSEFTIVLIFKRARDPKSVESSSDPFHTATARSLKNADLTCVLADFIYNLYDIQFVHFFAPGVLLNDTGGAVWGEDILVTRQLSGSTGNSHLSITAVLTTSYNKD